MDEEDDEVGDEQEDVLRDGPILPEEYRFEGNVGGRERTSVDEEGQEADVEEDGELLESLQGSG